MKALDTGQLTRDRLHSLHAQGLVKVTLGTAKKGGGSPGFGGLPAEG